MMCVTKIDSIAFCVGLNLLFEPRDLVPGQVFALLEFCKDLSYRHESATFLRELKRKQAFCLDRARTQSALRIAQV